MTGYMGEMRFLFNYSTHAVVWGMLEFDPRGNGLTEKMKDLLFEDRNGVYWMVSSTMHNTLEQARKGFEDRAWEGLVNTERVDLS